MQRRTRRSFVLRRHHLGKRENGGPVEINVGMLLFDGADRILVERRAPLHDARRGAVPVKEARPIARTIGVHQERIFETAAIAGQS